MNTNNSRMTIQTPSGKEWGTILSKEFEEPKHHAWVFFPNEEARKREYLLGYGVLWNPINPYSVATLLTESGYRFKKEQVFGTRWHALFEYGEPVPDFLSPSQWDQSDGEKQLIPSILVQGDLKRGMNLHITLGYFRTICINGLFTGLFGNLRFSTFTENSLARIREAQEKTYLNLVNTREAFEIRVPRQEEFEAFPSFLVPRKEKIQRLLNRVWEYSSLFNRAPNTVLELINFVTPPFEEAPASFYSLLNSFLRFIFNYSLFNSQEYSNEELLAIQNLFAIREEAEQE